VAGRVHGVIASAALVPVGCGNSGRFLLFMT
jgi:hypothetical protein